MDKHWSKLKNKQKAYLVCYHIIRYIAGSGDLADRNFLLLYGKVYALDEDEPTKGKLNKPGSLLKKKRSELIINWLKISENWKLIEIFLSSLTPPPLPINIVNVIKHDRKMHY
uniref:Uncharacterized protein n=1 Tax=viral metagenome TaxID=1070528 RepID=A0A6C0J7Q1_9ZZZZ